jgi:hypothetical protein
MSDVDLDQ